MELRRRPSGAATTPRRLPVPLGFRAVKAGEAYRFTKHPGGVAAASGKELDQMIDDGEVTVGFWFWPLSFLNSIIWLLVTANHLLLSRFVFLITKSERSLYQTTPNHDVI